MTETDYSSDSGYESDTNNIIIRFCLSYLPDEPFRDDIEITETELAKYDNMLLKLFHKESHYLRNNLYCYTIDFDPEDIDCKELEMFFIAPLYPDLYGDVSTNMNYEIGRAVEDVFEMEGIETLIDERETN